MSDFEIPGELHIGRRVVRSDEIDFEAPLFSIALASEIAGMHPQTLRQYDRLGLVEPQRTSGNTRRYSLRDIAQLREVQQLSADGISLPGISRILSLQNEVHDLKDRVRALETRLADEQLAKSGRRVFVSRSGGDIEPMEWGQRARRRTELILWRGSRGET